MDWPGTHPLERTQLASSDFDELVAALYEWSADFRPLDPSRTDSDIIGSRAGGLRLARARFCPRVFQTGSTPSGFHTFGLADGGFSWYGRSVTERDLLSFHASGEIACTSPRGFVGCALTVPIDALEAAAEERGLPAPSEILGPAERAFRLDPEDLRKLRSGLRLGLTDPSVASPAATREALARLPALILELAARAKGHPTARVSRGQRALVLKRAEAHLQDHAQRAVTVRQLCRAARCSERTLRYAFLERHGVGPKAFIQAIRLNGVHRTLRGADPRSVCVTDAANFWGFWHLGQFAADYRRMFGELPSETLRRSR